MSTTHDVLCLIFAQVTYNQIQLNEANDKNLKLQFQRNVTPTDSAKFIVELIQTRQKEYKELERCLQKLEGEVRVHIRDENQIRINYDELQSRIDELEKDRNEFLHNTRNIINKLKRENEEYYARIKQLTQELEQTKQINQKCQQYQERIKALEQLTQQSTKVSNSKISTLDNSIPIKRSLHRINEYQTLHTTQTPIRVRPEKSWHQDSSCINLSHNIISNKRLSQQNIQPYLAGNKVYTKSNQRQLVDKSKVLKNKKKQSCGHNNMSLYEFLINNRDMSSSM